MGTHKLGEVAWIDLTVNDASGIKNFYQDIVGWKTEEVPMEGYSDFAMISSESEQAVSGICHARGPNAELPPMWLPYFLVSDIETAVEKVTAQGGELITLIKSMGNDKYVVIKDPAGAACALYQKG